MTFGLIHGVQAGLRLLRHPAIAAAGFTGSTGGGLALAKIAAERPVPVPFYGELGSVNPSVVLPGAAFSRPAAIATGYTGSLTLGTGQFCTNPGLLFVPEDVGLLSAIAEAVGASAGGAMLTGRIFADFQDAVEEAAEHPGVTELAAGQPGPGPWGATPRVFQLTLKEFADDIAVLSRERFGPAGLVITYPSVEDLLPVLAVLAGNLVGTVHVDTGSPGRPGPGPPGGRGARAHRGPGRLQRLAHRRRGGGRAAPRRPVAGHHGAGLHLGGHGRDPPLARSRGVPGLPRRSCCPPAWPAGEDGLRLGAHAQVRCLPPTRFFPEGQVRGLVAVVCPLQAEVAWSPAGVTFVEVQATVESDPSRLALKADCVCELR